MRVTDFSRWCNPAADMTVGLHTMGVLVSIDDPAGIDAVAAHLPSRYAEPDALALVAERLGKPGVAAFLRNKFPQTQRARSGDLGEILASAYLEEDYGYVVGPSRLIHRDHQEWAMRGDDVLGARIDPQANVMLVKGEAKSRATAGAAVVEEARRGLARDDELPSAHSLTQFAERLLPTADGDLGEAVIALLNRKGIRPGMVTHLMFLFAGNDPSTHVEADLTSYQGEIVQRAVILRVRTHQEFIRAAFEKALANGA